MKQCNGSGSGKSRTVAIVSKVYCQDCQDYLQDNTEQSSIIIASFCFPERADDIVRTPKGVQVATTTTPQKNNRSDLKDYNMYYFLLYIVPQYRDIHPTSTTCSYMFTFFVADTDTVYLYL